MKFAMLACCAVMLVPVIGWFAMGQTITSIGQALTAFGPLIACLALHGVMFLVMGRSCHGSTDETNRTEATDVPEVAKVPFVARASEKGAAEAA